MPSTFQVTAAIDNPATTGSLRNEIAKAEAQGPGNVVDIAKGLTVTELQGEPSISVDTTLTINGGENDVINGAAANLFTVGASGALTVTETDVKNAGVSVVGGAATFTNDVLDGSPFVVSGAATLTVSNTTVQNVAAGVDAFNCTDATATFTGDDITENGGDWFNVTDTILSVTSCTISNNSGTSSTTGILISGGTTTVSNTVIINNTVQSVFDATLTTAQDVTISDSEVNDNTFTNAIFYASLDGSADINLTGDTFGGNQSPASAPGSVVEVVEIAGSVTINTTDIVDNAAFGIGETADNSWTVNNTVIYANMAGNIQNNPGQAVIQGTNDDIGPGINLTDVTTSISVNPDITAQPNPSTQLYYVYPGSPLIGAGTDGTIIGATQMLVPPPPPPPPPTTYTVTNSGDGTTPPVGSLRWAIDQANANPTSGLTINVQAGVNPDLDGPIVISVPMTIDLMGNTVTAAAGSPAFEATTGPVTITNGTVDASGAYAVTSNNSFALTDLTLSGGGVYVNETVLSVQVTLTNVGLQLIGGTAASFTIAANSRVVWTNVNETSNTGPLLDFTAPGAGSSLTISGGAITGNNSTSPAFNIAGQATISTTITSNTFAGETGVLTPGVGKNITISGSDISYNNSGTTNTVPGAFIVTLTGSATFTVTASTVDGDNTRTGPEFLVNGYPLTYVDQTTVSVGSTYTQPTGGGGTGTGGGGTGTGGGGSGGGGTTITHTIIINGASFPFNDTLIDVNFAGRQPELVTVKVKIGPRKFLKEPKITTGPVVARGKNIASEHIVRILTREPGWAGNTPFPAGEEIDLFANPKNANRINVFVTKLVAKGIVVVVPPTATVYY